MHLLCCNFFNSPNLADIEVAAISQPVTGVSGGTGAGFGYGALGGAGVGAVPFVPGAGQYSPAAKAAKYGKHNQHLNNTQPATFPLR